MFDHVGVNVQDYPRSRAFYEQTLAPLGYRVVMAFDEHKAAGFGTSDDKPEFWVEVVEATVMNRSAACDAGATTSATRTTSAPKS